MSGFLGFIIAFIVVFALGMVIRAVLKRNRKPSGSATITIKPQINLGNNNTGTSNIQPPQAAPAVFCSKCGARLEAGSTFCAACGNKVA